MNNDDERDFTEEAYWRAFCPECGTSPCGLPPGATDGYHYGPGPDTLDDPAEQAERDALMPLACGSCGAEADPARPDDPPEHFGWCPEQNRAYVRELLRERYPVFARTLEAAVVRAAVRENA